MLARDFDEADRWLAPLRKRPGLHITEFRALVKSYILLHAIRCNFDSALDWVRIWKRIEPNQADLPQLTALCSRGGGRARLARVSQIIRLLS